MFRTDCRIALPLLAAFLLAGPAGAAHAADATKPAAKAPAKARSAATPHCVFPDHKKQRAPAWVCGEAPRGQALFATGHAARAKGSGVQDTKDRAVAEARLKLAKQLGAQVEQRANRHATAIGVPLSQAGKIVTPGFEKKSQEVLVGSRIVESMTSKKGTIYVLVGLDAAKLKESIAATVKAAATAEPGAWQPLTAGKPVEQLAAQLAAE
jgi:hypothetical protein